MKCENLSPMQISDSEQEGAQHIRMDEQTKAPSPEEKCIEQSIDEDIIPDETETNILEQSQVKFELQFIIENDIKIKNETKMKKTKQK